MVNFREFGLALPPEKLADHLVSFLTAKFTNPLLSKLDIARMVTGFYSVSATTRKKFDALYFSNIREAAIASGRIPEVEVYDLLTTLPESGYGEFMSLNGLAAKSRELKQKGLSVGLKFGHYRRLSPAQIFEFIYVRHVCDHLILIIESGERTSKFKDKRLELSDAQRISMFEKSCLVNSLGITQGSDYSNDYYRNIVNTIKPSTLFISEVWPDEVKNEYVIRAKMAGAEPFFMPKIAELSTTEMEYLIFPHERVYNLSNVAGGRKVSSER